MNAEELRKACEMAGLDILSDAMGEYVVIDQDNSLPLSHPALPAYVAELLTAKVREMRDPCREYAYYRALHPEREHETDTSVKGRKVGLATAEQRIAAAMAVLGDGKCPPAR